MFVINFKSITVIPFAVFLILSGFIVDLSVVLNKKFRRFLQSNPTTKVSPLFEISISSAVPLNLTKSPSFVIMSFPGSIVGGVFALTFKIIISSESSSKKSPTYSIVIIFVIKSINEILSVATYS